MSRRKLYSYLFILLYWILVVNFMTAFGVMIVKNFIYMADIPSESLTNQMALYMISPSQFIEGLLAGTFLGLLFLLVNELSNRWHWDRFGFGRLILLKSFAYSIGLLLIFILVFNIINTLGYYPEDLLATFRITQGMMIIFIMMLCFLVFQIVLINYIIESSRKIGDFNVISFLTGKYRYPVLENRLFMFLDLRSSTSIAESLEDVRYSQMLRDCFQDFNYAIKRFNSLDIYQYVGDEVVVTSRWIDDRDLNDMIALYFLFSTRLIRRSDHYTSDFGLVPFFKAGIHGGLVSVTEIGSLRRDIAFHGDVINTASRIQNLCNELDESLLVSATTLNGQDSDNGFQRKSMGTFHLKGKEGKIDVVAIKSNE